MMNLKEIINRHDFRIITTRTDLMPLNKVHFSAYHKEFTREITRYQYPDPFSSLEEAEKVLTDFIRQRIEGSTLVCIITDSMGRFIGNVEAHAIDTPRPEVDVWIAQRYQRQGFVCEALTGIMDFLRMHSQVEYFIYEADVRNEGSMRLIKKLKGIKQGHEKFSTDCYQHAPSLGSCVGKPCLCGMHDCFSWVAQRKNENQVGGNDEQKQTFYCRRNGHVSPEPGL